MHKNFENTTWSDGNNTLTFKLSTVTLSGDYWDEHNGETYPFELNPYDLDGIQINIFFDIKTRRSIQIYKEAVGERLMINDSKPCYFSQIS